MVEAHLEDPVSEPLIPQSKQFYREKADRLQQDLDSAGLEILNLRANARTLQQECDRLEGERDAMEADRNMTMAELELYYELTNRLRTRWWWRFFGQPIVDMMKLENEEARRAIR